MVASTVTVLVPFEAQIVSPALRAVVGHWNEARRERKMPSWSELSPATLAPHLSMIWAFKYDRDSDDFTARLAGNRMMVGFGKSFRGTPMKDLHPPASFPTVHARMKRVVCEPACYRSFGPLFKANGRVIEGERVILPLGSDDSCADGALGASAYKLPVNTPADEVELLEGATEWFVL